MIIQSHQFGILRSDAMLFNNESNLPKGETGGCVINRQPEAQRTFDGHKYVAPPSSSWKSLIAFAFKMGRLSPFATSSSRWK